MVALLAWEGARLTPLASWWTFELLDIFAPWVYVPVLGLLLVSVPRVQHAAAFSVIVPLAFVGWSYVPLFLPHQSGAQQAPDQPSPRVMSTNLHFRNRDLGGVAATIAGQQPDLVVIQELGPRMARHLADTFREQYPHQLLEPRDTPFGFGILSRYPIHPEPGTDVESCRCQRVTIDLLVGPATLVNVHPPIPIANTSRQSLPRSWPPFDADLTRGPLMAAIAGLDAAERPVLLVGDFNLSDRQPLYRELSQRFADAYRAAGWGYGFTYGNIPTWEMPQIRLVRIDYVFYNDAWKATAAWTGHMPGSDHRYLVADLTPR